MAEVTATPGAWVHDLSRGRCFFPPYGMNRFSEFTPAERTNVFCVCELFNPPLN